MDLLSNPTYCGLVMEFLSSKETISIFPSLSKLHHECFLPGGALTTVLSRMMRREFGDILERLRTKDDMPTEVLQRAKMLHVNLWAYCPVWNIHGEHVQHAQFHR